MLREPSLLGFVLSKNDAYINVLLPEAVKMFFKPFVKLQGLINTKFFSVFLISSSK